MTPDELLVAFGDLTLWKRGERWAPHKPLLILLSLGEWQRSNRSPLSFAAVRPRLRALLRSFGPPRADGPDDPFWRLKNDNQRKDPIWQLGCTGLSIDLTTTDPPGSAEMERVTGWFSDEVCKSFDRWPGLVGRIARRLLDARFPASLHPDILAAVNLDIEAAEEEECPPIQTQPPRRRRDPRFRESVLAAYEKRCALCGVGLHFVGTDNVIGVEAAHIKWFQADGPDDACNGLALCSLHHKAFDSGAFTVEPDGQVVVSSDVDGAGADVALHQFRNDSLRPPTSEEARPGHDFLAWHREEVFRRRGDKHA